MPWRGGSRSAELIENRRRVCISGKTLPDRPRLPPWFATSGGQTMELSQKKVPGVAPRAGAWIETSTACCPRPRQRRRSPCGSVDRNRLAPLTAPLASGRSPCGSVDRNCDLVERWKPIGWSLPVRERGSKHPEGGRGGPEPRRSPCGSVDRNCPQGSMAMALRRSLPVRERGSKLMNGSRRSRIARRSPCGSVDRNTLSVRVWLTVIHVAPRAGAWIETPRERRWSGCARSRSPCGSVDRNTWCIVVALTSAASLPVRERGSKPGG